MTNRTSRAGRPIKTFTDSTGQHTPGLSRCPDGRWRIIANGKEQRWTDADEYRAVAKARKLLGLDEAKTTAVEVALSQIVPNLPNNPNDITEQQADQLTKFWDAAGETDDSQQADRWQDNPQRLNVPDAILFPWLRSVLCDRPEWLAAKVGIPELAGLRNLALPQASLKLSTIIENYRTHRVCGKQGKAAAIRSLENLAKFCEAKTLADLTTEKLNKYRQHIETTVAGPATRKVYYTNIKTIIRFGLKTGMDAGQIAAALARLAVLWTDAASPAANPQPIDPQDFRKLLAAGGDNWRAFLLCGLNLAMHIQDVCNLKWESLDLEAGTYAAIRNKTKRHAIPQAATLWTETVAALKAIHRNGSPFVFVSKHGTPCHRSARSYGFRQLRIAAGLDSLTFDQIRDGAYTAAAKVDERAARVMAGHAASGLIDRYVLRNPNCARPACDAVAAHYRPF